MLVGGVSTVAPRRSAAATVASTSGTPMYASQCGVAPGLSTAAPSGPDGATNIEYEASCSQPCLRQPATWE
jgi:hypothetical protein